MSATGALSRDMLECHTLDQRLADALPVLSPLISGLDARATIPQMEAACGDDQVALVLRHLQPLSAHDVEQLLAFEQASGLRLYLQPKGPDTVAPLQPKGAGLGYALPAFDLWFEFEPLDFIQVNGALNGLMVEQALDLLALKPEHRVLDLFCGLGNFSLPMAAPGRAGTGPGGCRGSGAARAANARATGLSNARFQAADLYGEALCRTLAAQAVDRILLDPPRSGAGPLLALLGSQPGAADPVRIVQSAQPGEDAGKLVHDLGYGLVAAGVMDMFPHTAHIEAMAMFERS